MKRFSSFRGWALIEWFMALVFFAKAWGEVGSVDRKTLCLMRALKVRRLVVPRNRPLTPSEQVNLRWNLRWWAGVALETKSRPKRYDILSKAEDLVDALASATDEYLVSMIDNMLRVYDVPL